MNKIKKIIKEINPKALFLPVMFDRALIGTSKTCGQKEVAAYSADECIKILIAKQDMDEIEAYEYFQSAMEAGEFSDFKPVFINDFRKIRNLSKDIEKYISEGEGTIDKFPDL